MKGLRPPLSAPGAEARWNELLRSADASVVRALKLAGIANASDLLSLRAHTEGSGPAAARPGLFGAE